MIFNLQGKDIKIQTFLLTGKIKKNNIINNLIEIIKSKKNNDLYSKTNVKGHFTGFDSLNNNNFFIEFISEIKEFIQIVYPNNFTISNAWGNILNKGGEVIEHKHGVNAFCGILYLTEGGPGTFFKEYDITIEEEIGKFILFHPMLNHKVNKIEKDIERITLAFNMDAVKEWENIKWINKNDI